jgi:hypothetical protein
LSFRNAQSGEVHWRFEAPTWSGATFSPDGQYFLLPSHPPGRFVFTLYDVAEKKKLWQRSWVDDFNTRPQFTPDSRTIVAEFSDLSQVEILDAATGQSRHTIVLPGAVDLEASLCKGGRSMLVFHAPDAPFEGFLGDLFDRFFRGDIPHLLHMYDLETGRERWCVRAEFVTDSFHLTDDHRVLVSVRRDNEDGRVDTIFCWAVPPRASLWWPVGMPVAIGLLAASCAVWWKRRGAHRPATTPAAPVLERPPPC